MQVVVAHLAYWLLLLVYLKWLTSMRLQPQPMGRWIQMLASVLDAENRMLELATTELLLLLLLSSLESSALQVQPV